VFGALTREELSARLKDAQIAFGLVNSVADFSQHPQLRRFAVDSPGGPIDVVAPPVRVDGAAPKAAPIPAIGAHTEAIRAEFAAARDVSRAG
jgi:crotonobetainyl-CoA:carnitine CoA-transferase CaiB-like acyl-CoA transferase